MPLYDYVCPQCGNTKEVKALMSDNPPECCGGVMNRQYTGSVIIKWKHPLWVDRIDDKQKVQADRGERLKFVHPREVL